MKQSRINLLARENKQLVQQISQRIQNQSLILKLEQQVKMEKKQNDLAQKKLLALNGQLDSVRKLVQQQKIQMRKPSKSVDHIKARIRQALCELLEEQ
ncbi:hypothetical protein pb186bvf_016520 [Paramecium bursaria]